MENFHKNIEILRSRLHDQNKIGKEVFVWFRDDDFYRINPNFKLMENLAIELKVNFLLAVIPALLKVNKEEAAVIEGNFLVGQHGNKHENHEPEGVLNSEFGVSVSYDSARNNILEGMSKIEAIFGGNRPGIFVPPWNNFDEKIMPILLKEGFSGVSSFGFNSLQASPRMCKRVDYALDIIAAYKKSDGDFLKILDECISKIIRYIDNVRNNITDRLYIGIQMHHRMMTDDYWPIIKNLLFVLESSFGMKRISASEVFS